MPEAEQEREQKEEEELMAVFRTKKPAGKPGEWFYCLDHKKAEEGPQCPSKNRFGPYPSREAAEAAMEQAAERNLEWDTDPRWSDKS